MKTNESFDRGRSIEAIYSLAHKKIGQENYEDAATLLRLMLHLAPSDERAWLGLGVCHEQREQLDVARELYAAGSVAAQPSPRCALACGRVLCKQEQWDLAEEQYHHAITLSEALGIVELQRTAQEEWEMRR